KKYQNIITSVALSLSMLFNTSLVAAAPKIVEQVAAVVNKDVILETDVNRMLSSIKMSVPNPAELPPDEELRKQVMDRLIMESLILQQAANLKIRIPDSAVDQEIANIAAENGMSVDQLRGNLAGIGMTYVAYRAQIKKGMEMEEVRNHVVGDRITILPQEVDMLVKHMLEEPEENYEINLSHILISLPEEPTMQQLKRGQAKAQDIINQLNRKANFATMAATYSAAPDALEGGQMG